VNALPQPPTVPARARLFAEVQHLLPHHALSRVVLHLTRSRVPVLKDFLIGAFVRSFRPRMSDAAEPDPLHYASFNEFFTRALRPDARPIVASSETVISPVDGTISQIGYLDKDEILQAKGQYFGLQALLGGRSAWTERLAGGAFATLYLAPYNYHRIHMPLPGSLRTARYVPGRLFSVNAASVARVPRLFARNERVVLEFELAGLPFAMVLIGALFVGSIATVWHGDVTPRRPRHPLELAVPDAEAAALAQGAEVGRFNMGSTVILIFPRHSLEWLSGLAPGAELVVGQPLGHLRGPG
jgi:phosphatidylserine decarboxylase